jgi:hypothetical protein
MTSSNKHFLPDGRFFIINTDKESPTAWNDKKAFIISVGIHELKHNKVFTAKVIQLLATGMIGITKDGKRKTKSELIEGLEELIKEARELGSLELSNVEQRLKDSGFNSAKLDILLASMSGVQLVDGIEAILENNGFADSTIVKTYLPDIYKKIRLNGGDNCEETVRLLKFRYQETTKDVNAKTQSIVVHNSHNVRPIDVKYLNRFIDSLDLEKASWKELSVYIALSTGRRMAEVHGIDTKFEYVDNETILFTGQLKTKDRSVGNKPYQIHVFCEAVNLVKAWERLKILRQPLEPEAVNKLLSKPLSTELPTHLKLLFEQAGITKYKDMRDIYAARMLQFKPENMTANAFVGSCMGHGENDLNTAETYQKIRIVE